MRTADSLNSVAPLVRRSLFAVRGPCFASVPIRVICGSAGSPFTVRSLRFRVREARAHLCQSVARSSQHAQGSKSPNPWQSAQILNAFLILLSEFSFLSYLFSHTE